MPSESEVQFLRRLVDACRDTPGAAFTEADARRVLERATAEEERTGVPVLVAELAFHDPEARIPPSAMLRAQSDQKRRIVLCPNCATKNNVWGKDRAKAVRCPACQQPFFFSEGLFPVGDPAGLPPIDGFEFGPLVLEGGQGAVYRGKRTADGATVAIKVVPWGFRPDPADRERFRREAELAAALDHPNILRVLAHRVLPARGVLVMEWAGRSLQERVEAEGPCAPRAALDLARQVFAGLAYAHGRDVIHRDIKPANLTVGDDGVLRIVDFGLAKRMAAAGLSGITSSGMGMGTLEYAPPEQVERFRMLDARADLYSAGASLYFLLCGHPPYEGRNAAELQRKLLHEPPTPVREHAPGTPESVVDLVDHLLAHDPAGRPASASEALVELDAIRL